MNQLSRKNIKKPESPKRSQQDLLDLKVKFAKLLESQKLPFVITGEMVRYLDDILYLYNECSLDSNVLYMIKQEIDGETDQLEREDRYFWQYLKEQNIAVLLSSVTVEEVEKIVGDVQTSKLIAVARPHRRREPLRKFFARSGHWRGDLEKVVRQTRESEQDEEYIPYLAIRVFEIELIKELFYFFKNKSLKEYVENESNHAVSSVQVIQDSKVRFDPLNGVIRYGDEMLRFHRGEKGDKPRLALLKDLWKLKKHIKNGKIKAEGRPFPPEALAVRLNITSEVSAFQRNPQTQDRFYGFIKGINRELRDKSIPMRIERNNGIQIVITEK